MITSRPEPRHPGRLAGSKWTRCEAGRDYTHYVAIEVTGDAIALQAILAPSVTLRLPWRDLRDRTRWQPGWR